jgi:hypothetical protein
MAEFIWTNGNSLDQGLRAKNSELGGSTPTCRKLQGARVAKTFLRDVADGGRPPPDQRGIHSSARFGGEGKQRSSLRSTAKASRFRASGTSRDPVRLH